MHTSLNSAQGAGADSLTIGDLATRTGVSAATLRMWEQRHGFPVPARLDSGHRRFSETDVEDVRAVVERRDSGIRLEAAIAQVREARSHPGDPAAASVFADLRRRHPQLEVFRLTKRTLLALSWAIEDEFCAKADRPRVFGAFQRVEYFERALPRWRELARISRGTIALADFDEPGEVDGITKAPLAEDSPLRREWAVVCDSAELPAALTAWEIPGQTTVPDHARLFESIWTVEPHAVRDAARVCARAAGATTVLAQLEAPPARGTTDLGAVTTLFNRVVAYVDEAGRRHS